MKNTILQLLENLPSNVFVGRTWLFTEKCKDMWIAVDSKGWMINRSKTLLGLLKKLK